MPQIRMRDITNTLRTIARIRMRDETNTLRNIQRIRMRDEANVLRTVYQYLSAVLDTNLAYGTDSGPSINGSVTTNSVTVTAAGTGPLTYLWTRVSGDAITIDSPTAATTTFSGTVGATGKTALFKCTVTDANGSSIDTETVFAQIEWFDDR